MDFCETLANKGKIVIVAALDGTFDRKPFHNILELIPLAEKIQKLTAVCWFCKRENASFTKRTVSSQESMSLSRNLVELIGGDECYKPACRGCFHKSHLKEIENFNEVSTAKKGKNKHPNVAENSLCDL